MKITCILSSYNRPRMVRDALKSISDQTHRDYEVIVVDDSDQFDIRPVVEEFGFADFSVIHNSVSPQDVARQNRVAINCNAGLRKATGDLICYLCDDDYYYSDWFKEAAAYFTSNPGITVAFGKLSYHHGTDMLFSYDRENVRFFPHPVREPFHQLDHNQVMHRRFSAPIFWDESPEWAAINSPDGYFWNRLASQYLFFPIDAYAAVKRIHSLNLQRIIDVHRAGKARPLRE